MKLTETEKHYWELSEVYLGWYNDMERPMIATGLAMGVIVEMESDLQKHLITKKIDLRDETTVLPKNVKNQIDRLSILKKSVALYASIAESNFLVKGKFAKLYKRIDHLETENKDLQYKLDNAQEFFDKE